MKKDYYGLLGVSRDAGETELTKAYRKLSVKVHPDRNKAAGAEEAFKTIGNAYAVLKDPTKRQVYDVHGEEGLSGGAAGGGGGGGFHHGGAHFTFHRGAPEDLFDLFFDTHRFYTRQHGQGHHRQQQQHEMPPKAALLQGFMQFLPIILLLFAMNAGFAINEEPAPMFSLERDSHYSVQRTVRSKDINYFVTRAFDRDLKRAGQSRVLGDLENKVTHKYKGFLKQKCKEDKNEQHNMRQRANYYNGRDAERLRQKADQHPLRNCREYDRMFKWN